MQIAFSALANFYYFFRALNEVLALYILFQMPPLLDLQFIISIPRSQVCSHIINKPNSKKKSKSVKQGEKMRFLQSGMLGIESNRSSSALKFIFGFLIWEQGLKTARYMQNYIVSPTCGPLITIVSALCLYCQVKLIMVKKSFYKRKSPLWASLPPVGDYRKNYNFLVSIVFNSLIIKVGSTCISLKYIERDIHFYFYIYSFLKTGK